MAKKRSSKQVLKNSTSGRKHLQDPSIVDPKKRRDLTQVKSQRPLMEKEVYKVIDWMREGRSNEWCTQALRETINERTNRVYAPRFVENIVTTAHQLIDMWYRNQIYQIEKIHICRYNKIIINRLNRNYDNYPSSKPWLATQAESADLNIALQALKQKETLLGMHRKTFRLIFNSQTNIINGKSTPKQKEPKINLDKLTLDEQIELLQLLDKTSKSENELFGVILKENKKIVEDISTEAETVETTNINYIEQFKPRESSLSKNPPLTLEEIQRRLQQNSIKNGKS